MRVAVLDVDRCKPKRCDKACQRFCPMVKTGVEAIRFDDTTPTIVEALCSGCGICVKKCPFHAISIVNVPDILEGECSHQYGPNSFRLFRLPTPARGVILGLLGQNGTGKTTALKILAGEVKPNLGMPEEPPDWPEIVRRYRGSTLQGYFEALMKGELKVVHKPQYVDKIPKVVSGKVGEILRRVDEAGRLEEVSRQLNLKPIWDRQVDVLSGGELQLVAIAATACRDADVYLFDEPSSYLDVKQRLRAARVIRSLRGEDKVVVVVEHDLAALDYLSDQICIFYGVPGVYGIVSHVHGVKDGINIYLQGYIPDENIRFRKEPVVFQVKPPAPTWQSEDILLSWSEMTKSYNGFTLSVEPGVIHRGEVVGVMGPNGIGKTTFVKLLAGIEEPDSGEKPVERLKVSYKPQYISAEYEGTVETLLKSIVGEKFATSWYKTEVIRALSLEGLLDRDVSELSGGELQLVAVAACLSQDANLYLLDEPSAYLDVEQRLAVARTIRRMVKSRGAAAFVVEHDVVAQDFISDSLMVFHGEPGVRGVASTPTTLRDGMNRFLKEMGVTFRRDAATRRPRVNKEGSRLDRYQKEIGEYYYVAVED